MTHLAPPTAVRPRPGLQHAVRALVAGRRRGVDLTGRPRLGRGVHLQAAPGARIVLGDSCVIGDGCRLLARGGEVRVEAGATLGERCVLVAHAGIAVASGAVLGDRVMIADFDPGTDDVERPVRLQPITTAPVSVGAGSRIGHGASLLRGVTIDAGAVVGAHAVVTREPPPVRRG